MKRILLWCASTVSVLVLPFGYHTSTSGTRATSAPTSIISGMASGVGSGSSATSGSGSSGSRASGSGSSSSTGSGSGGSGGAAKSGSSSSTRASTVTGAVASTQWGPVQVQLTMNGATITKVSVLQYPSGNSEDTQINAHALPILIQETIDHQSATNDMVSGATVTSTGYLQSLQSALDQANA